MKLCACLPRPPAVPAPEPVQHQAPAPDAETALRLEALVKQVSELTRTVEEMTRKIVTRESLASMAGVEEAKLDETKLRTGAGGWRFLGAAAEDGDGDGDGDGPGPMDRVPLD